MDKHKIIIPKEKIEQFCKRNNITKLSLFGSVLGDEFSASSDIDVLVEFVSGKEPGFIRLSRMERELSGILGGRKVDLVTEQFLNRRIRERVLAQAEVQYAQR